ncbi:hypothetical protein COHA_001286 [Chlorella ohadii]|uniref:Uncharacterized protein n=1 Tax=Chlorella ohadii TaxID=2649997 RepID=A0AAD5DZR6_9CHLO|nr:hypothetical protein COHA_001286 [Chlorella ohadii]
MDVLGQPVPVATVLRHRVPFSPAAAASTEQRCVRQKWGVLVAHRDSSSSAAAASVTDIQLEASDLRLTLSPDVLELGGRLAASVLEPLMQPQPDQPLASCNQFERVWSFDPADWLAEHQPGGQLAVSLAVTGAEVCAESCHGGVTVWRAKSPTGYGVTGDVVMPGATQPTFEVLAVAVNSGLAAYPTGYTRVWAGAGGAIWRPQPPPGYVAAGDLFSTETDREPELAAMVCLHEGTVVECAPGERLSLPPQLPHTPAASALVAAAVPHVDLWCNDNSLGTFYAGTAAEPFPERSFDLRSPLGVTPAALLAMGAAEEVAWAAPKQQLGESAAQAAAAGPAEAGRLQDVQQPAAQQVQQAQQLGKVASLRKQKEPGEMFRRFESSRRHLQTESAARLVTPSVVDFRRVWAWDGNGDGSGPGISIWRPLPPPGYVALGDCLERGYDPPVAASVVQDAGGDASGPGAAQPLVKPHAVHILVLHAD